MSEEDAVKKTGSGFGGGLAVFVALVAVGIASYPAYELYRQSDQEQARSLALDARLEQLERDLQRRDAQLDELETRLAATEGEADTGLDDLATRIDEDLEVIRSRLTTSSDDWLFAEVEYLVRMANQRVLMEKDASSALQLLNAADRIVRDAEGLTAHTLRQALAKDIAALEAAPTTDTQGIYLQLSALVGQVGSLKRELPVFFEVEVEAVEPQPESASISERLSAMLGNAGTRIAGLVDFRSRDAEIKPILPPEQAYYLRQNLVLKLQMAQMALLEGEAEVYKVSLVEAQRWLEGSFNDDAARQAMAASLMELSALNIDGDLPDVSGSLEAARDMLRDFDVESVQ